MADIEDARRPDMTDPIEQHLIERNRQAASDRAGFPRDGQWRPDMIPSDELIATIAAVPSLQSVCSDGGSDERAVARDIARALIARTASDGALDEDPYQEIHMYEGDSVLVIRDNGNSTLHGVRHPALLLAMDEASGRNPADAGEAVGEVLAEGVFWYKPAATNWLPTGTKLYTAAALSLLQAERDDALTEHTDMMWQRRRADERAEAAEQRVAELERITDRLDADLNRAEEVRLAAEVELESAEASNRSMREALEAKLNDTHAELVRAVSLLGRDEATEIIERLAKANAARAAIADQPGAQS